MKIAIFAFLMVVVLTLVESQRGRSGWRRGNMKIDTVYGFRLKRDLNNKLVQRVLGNGQRRYIRDVNTKHHVYLSKERVPAARVARKVKTLQNGW